MRHDEWDLQVQVVKALRDAGWIAFHIPNERNSGIADSKRMKAGGVVKGAPDLICFGTPHHQRVVCFWLELKTPKGKRSIEQECMEEIALLVGAQYRVVRSVDDIKDLICE